MNNDLVSSFSSLVIGMSRTLGVPQMFRGATRKANRQYQVIIPGKTWFLLADWLVDASNLHVHVCQEAWERHHLVETQHASLVHASITLTVELTNHKAGTNMAVEGCIECIQYLLRHWRNSILAVDCHRSITGWRMNEVASVIRRNAGLQDNWM